MASSYSISDGTGRVKISSSIETYLAVQLSASSLDADVTYKLQHSSDGTNFIDIPSTSGTLVSASDTALVETYDYTLVDCYLYIDVGSATTGTVNVFSSSKKKEDSGSIEVSNQVITGTNIDAFNRLRVSQIRSQADLKQIHDELPLFYDIEEIGTGSQAHSTANAESTLTTAASSDAVIMQTKQRYNYSSGKSSLMFITFRNFNTETNITKRIGYFNSNTTTPFDSSKDGFYLENANGIINFVITKGGVANTIPQADWNDSLDGNGDSGVNLDLGTDTGNYIFWADYEWLGVGRVRFGFIKNGVLYVAHVEDHIMSDGVYMETPNHSIRGEIRQTGVGSGTFRIICSTYGSEGAIDNLGKILSDNMGSTHVDANSTSSTYALMGVRLGSSYLDTLVDVLGFTILAITNDNQRWELWLNPTVAGTFTYSAVSNSSIETAKGSGSGNTVTTTGATLIDSGYISASTADRFQIQSAIRLGATIAGTADEMVLCTTPLSSNSDVIASLTWREIS